MKVLIKEIPANSILRILDHHFRGLEEIKAAVEVYSRICTGISGDRHMWRVKPQKPIPGIHVLQLYEPYPCFDSDDYASEDRDYCNFFFSREPFTDADINRLAGMKTKSNYCMVYEEMNPEVLPAVYFEGSSWHKLILAIPG